MKTKVLFKIIIIFIIFNLILNCILLNKTYASLTDMVKKAEDFASEGKDDINGFNEEALQVVSGDVYNILLVIGIIIAVMAGIILGIQWMISSVEDKPKIKEALIPYIVGCIVIFGGFTIWKTVVDFGQSQSAVQQIKVKKTESFTCSCGRQLSNKEIFDGKCSSCGKDIISGNYTKTCTCGRQLSNKEIFDGKCSSCGKEIEGVGSFTKTTTIDYKCPYCGQQIEEARVLKSENGTINCPKCGRVIDI